MTYSQNPEPIKQRAREHSAVTYCQNPEPIKERAREHSAMSYSQNPEPQRKRLESTHLNLIRKILSRKGLKQGSARKKSHQKC